MLEILRNSSRKHKVAVVLSAFGGVTDDLEKAGELAAAGDESYLELLGALEQRHFSVIKELLEAKKQTPVLAQTKMVLNELEDVLNGAYLVKELSRKTCDL